MSHGILFAFVAFALYSCCDAIIKAIGSGLSIYEIAFFSALFSLVPVFFATPRGENWLYFWQHNNAPLMHLRAIAAVIGNLCIILSFVSIRLAEVYSIAFLAPIFVVLIAVTILGERVTRLRALLLALSFVGVLVVVRPGFREVQWGHLTALIAAACSAVTMTTLRKLAESETRVALVGLVTAYVAVTNGVLMALTGSFAWPTPSQWGLLMAVGGFGGVANIAIIAASRTTQASRIAPMQYFQILWAVLFGAVFFAEYPDTVTYAGLGIIAIAGVLNVLSEKTGPRIISRNLPAGAGPATLRETAREA